MGSEPRKALSVVGMFRASGGGGNLPAVSPRTGRPKSPDPRVHVVNVRLSEAEIQLVRAAADRYDLPMGSWARERLLAAARKALKD